MHELLSVEDTLDSPLVFGLSMSPGYSVNNTWHYRWGVLVATPPTMQLIHYETEAFHLAVPWLGWRVIVDLRQSENTCKLTTWPDWVIMLQEQPSLDPENRQRCYRLPLPNVYADGAICMGQEKYTDIAKGSLADAVGSACASFWQSLFNDDVRSSIPYPWGVMEGGVSVLLRAWEDSTKSLPWVPLGEDTFVQKLHRYRYELLSSPLSLLHPSYQTPNYFVHEPPYDDFA